MRTVGNWQGGFKDECLYSDSILKAISRVSSIPEPKYDTIVFNPMGITLPKELIPSEDPLHLNGMRIIENRLLTSKVQIRFPRSKKKRIRKKWAKMDCNFMDQPSQEIMLMSARKMQKEFFNMSRAVFLNDQ